VLAELEAGGSKQEDVFGELGAGFSSDQAIA
jgi:hypothetical protein